VLVGGFEIHVKEVAAQAVPEGHFAALMLYALDFHYGAIGEPFPVAGDEHHAGAGKQLKGRGVSQFRFEGEGAQQGQISQGVAGVKHFHAPGDVEFVGGVNKVIAAVVVERLAVACPGVYAGGAGELAGVCVFQYEEESAWGVGFVGEAGLGLFEFFGQGGLGIG